MIQIRSNSFSCVSKAGQDKLGRQVTMLRTIGIIKSVMTHSTIAALVCISIGYAQTRNSLSTFDGPRSAGSSKTQPDPRPLSQLGCICQSSDGNARFIRSQFPARLWRKSGRLHAPPRISPHRACGAAIPIRVLQYFQSSEFRPAGKQLWKSALWKGDADVE